MNPTYTAKLPIRKWFAAATALVVVVLASSGFAQTFDPWQVAVDYDRLVQALGANVPNGAGVPVAIIEGGGPYMPDASYHEYTGAFDPFGQPVVFANRSGVNNAASTHATFNVGRFFFGDLSGIAKGVNQVDVWQANNWLDNQVKYTQTAPPIAQTTKVQNHSWVWNSGDNNNDLAALRRYDYLIETGDITAVVGANNNVNSTTGLPDVGQVHPNLMVHSYNAIVAGRTDGGHSRGMTSSVYGPGRFRPDIVSAFTLTSSTTAQISSAAAMLRGAVAGSGADRSETMKAILMAGATKTEFANFVEPSTGVVNPWNRTQTRPLDDIFGAGELNVYNSYLMTAGGQHAGSTVQPTTTAKSYGWDYQNRKAAPAAVDFFYNFVVPNGSTAQELSIILAWNVKITDTNPAAGTFTPTESLQNLNLTLYDSSASFLGSVVDQSISNVDNVEHIYQTGLGPGVYTLKVSGAASWDYGLAWRMSTLFDQPNADFDGDGMVSGLDFLSWQQNLGTLVGASHAQGDADGDGDVDAADLAVYDAARALGAVTSGNGSGTGSSGGASGPNGTPGGAGIPEPAALTLAAMALGLGAATRRARHLRQNARRQSAWRQSVCRQSV